MIVDDEHLIRFGFEALLQELGYDTEAALTGSKALEMLSKDADVEVCLTDFPNPGLSVLDWVEQCRALRPELRLKLMTENLSKSQSFSDDCPMRLVKPLSMSDLTIAREQCY